MFKELHQQDMTQTISLLNNKDDYQFNVISAPGLNGVDHGTQVNSLVALAQSRTDCLSQ